jgi:hypothetical protein
VEKALLDELRLHYLHAHQIAGSGGTGRGQGSGRFLVGLSAFHEEIREAH